MVAEKERTKVGTSPVVVSRVLTFGLVGLRSFLGTRTEDVGREDLRFWGLWMSHPIFREKVSTYRKGLTLNPFPLLTT